MRRQTLIALVLLVSLVGGAALTVGLIGARRAARELSRSLMTQAAARTEAELDRFFAPTARAITVARGWGERGRLSLPPAMPEATPEGDDTNGAPDAGLEALRALNARFTPIVHSDPAITSALVATAAGDEYMILEGDRGVIRNRVVRIADEGWGTARNLRLRFDDSGALAARRVEHTPYDPRQRPWFRGAMATPGTVHWTEPYLFRTTREPGITASVAFESPTGPMVVAFDVKLIDITRFTQTVRVSEHGWVAVVDEADRVIGAPRAPGVVEPERLFRAEVPSARGLDLPALNALLDAPPSTGDDPLGHRVADSYGMLLPHPLGEGRTLRVAVMLPEADVRGHVDEQRNWLAGVLIVGLLLAFVVTLLIDRAVQKRLESAAKNVTQVGQYLLGDRIGGGGMGTVYRAQHAMLRRPTAVKLLREDRRRQKDFLRFEREVKMTAQLTHPNTIAIYDYGRTPDGAFYYAMELLDGVTLDQLVAASGPLPPARVIHILRGVLGSLAEAHDIGLLHRDIKPANIMLCDRGGLMDFVKLLDFGLVKRFDTESELDLSGTGQFAGTPLFIAPESVSEPQSLDPRSDLYAVAAVGYYLLTGTHVFHGKNAIDTITMHMKLTPEAPSKRLGHTVAPDLERVILRGLEKDPMARPADARVFTRLLDTCADAHGWRQDDARLWWEVHGEAFGARTSLLPMQDGEDRVAMTVDMRSRGEEGA